MAVKLVFLGRLEDISGEAEREVQAADSLEAILAKLPASLIEALRDPRIRLAHNGALASDPAMLSLSDGDELAFLPPVSGG